RRQVHHQAFQPAHLQAVDDVCHLHRSSRRRKMGPVRRRATVEPGQALFSLWEGPPRKLVQLVTALHVELCFAGAALGDETQSDLGPTVWVVDDGPGVTRAVARLLRSAAFEVVALDSIQQLLDRLAQGEPDCLLLDLWLGDANALALL